MRPDLPGMAARTAAVEGVRFHLHRSDPKRRRRTTPTLLLHGVPETALAWEPLVPALTSDRTVLAPDLKGLGESEVRGPYDIPTLVAELAALVLHEVDGPVDVVGHDWGGSLGLALAGSRPDLVRRLVVISAPYRKVDVTAAWHVPLLALPVLPEVAFRLGARQIVPRMFRYAWRAAHPVHHLDHYVDAYADPERYEAMLGYYRATARPRIAHAALAAVGVRPRRSGQPRVQVDRALVVWGADDPVLPVEIGESVVRDLGPSATFLTLPGVGHWPVEEAPDVVVPAIADFLRAP